MLVVLYTIVASLGYSMHSVAARRAMLRGTAADGVFITVLAGLPLFAIAAALSGQLARIGDLPIAGYLALIGAGVMHYVLGRYCNYRAMGAIGTNRAAPVQGTQILYSLVFAVVFLSEEVTLLMGAGILLILAGPLLVVRGSRSRAPRTNVPIAGGAEDAGGSTAATAAAGTRPQVVFTPRLVEGYVFAALNGALYGSSPVLIRYGIGGTDLGFAGGLVAYGAAGVLLLPVFLLRLRRAKAGMSGIDRGTQGWLAIATLSITGGVMFRYMALTVAPVTLVMPLMRAGGFFRLLLAYLFNRRIESFQPRVLVGIALSMLGALTIIVSRT